jgi:PAS domain S-box-containing protein
MTASMRRVLVVEDNPITRKMLRVTLETEGYSVVEVGDGRSALAAARESMPELILQDLVLPDMSGFDLLRELRQLPGGAETPILALSGFISRLEDVRSAEAGFTAMLIKPVEPSRLLEAIKPYLPASTPTISIPAAAGRRLLLVDDDPVQLKIVRLHLAQLGFDVTSANSTEEALRYARVHPPEIVVADVLMPDLDGFQLCFELRQDQKLAGIPVVLVSAWYQSDTDQDFAKRVGANALVQRTPDVSSWVPAIHEALEAGAPVLSETLSVEVQLEHAKRVIHQLERQLALRADLARRSTLQAAQISLLGGVADALARSDGTDAVLRDVLAATLDAAGISKGALFLRDETDALVIRHAIGFSFSENAGLTDFFGQFALLEVAIERKTTMPIPSPAIPSSVSRAILARADVASAQIVPLVSEGRGVGAMVLAAKRTDMTNDDSIAFARAMGNQLAQSLELAAAFARLSASELRYRTVTESAYDAIFILTTEGSILEVNRAVEELLGFPRERIIGRQLVDFAAPGYEQENLNSYTRRVAAGAGKSTPIALGKADGSVILLDVSSRSVDVGGDRLVFSVGRDVTEQTKVQAQLMASDRMASVGALAAGVAHEINNPLAAVTANLEFAAKSAQTLAERFPRPEFRDLVEGLVDAREAADRVRVIVRDLKMFSRAEEDVREPVELRRVIESSLRMAWNEIRHRAQLVKDYGDIPMVEANESRLGQVFLNLIVNAAQALPEGHADVNFIRIRTRNDQSGRVVTEIEDTGSGIRPEVLKRLFTPFFTTKPRGVGTGLGLSICQRIVSDLGGEITAESPAGRGATFRVFLQPVVFDSGSQKIAPPVVLPATRRGRILIVDDEAVVAKAIRRMLAPQHEVVIMTSAKEALARLASGERFDVILCDLMMPVMTGVHFYEELLTQSPAHAERIVFLTGGVFTTHTREFLDRVPNARLEKPFESQTLKALVNERLRQPAD